MGSLRKTELSIKTKAINEPRHEKNMLFAYAKTKAQISCAVPLRAVNTLEKKMDHMQGIKRRMVLMVIFSYFLK